MVEQKRNIAFIDTFNGEGAAEQETSKRLKYCFEKFGNKFVHLYNDMKTRDNTHMHADNLNLDFCYAHEIVTGADKVLPDCFSVFFHWAPTGFNGTYWCDTYVKYMNKFDVVAGGYETQDAAFDICNNGCNRYCGQNIDLYNITSSISKDFVLLPQKNQHYRLFYVGINLEAVYKTMRYSSLIKYCDVNNLIDIYGPNKSFNIKGGWDGFKCYKGSIPLDGYSIIEKINQAGICLALNSSAHNAVGSVSNRIYEAACAGAVIISDDNPYVRKYFGDSVFYIDVKQSEDEQIENIKNIINYIKQNPDEAYEMACRSQKVFIEKLALDSQVEGLISFIDKQKELMTDISLQKDTVDVICYIDSVDDWESIKEEIYKQYYKNLHIIVVTDEAVYKKLVLNDIYSFDFVQKENFRGKSFIKLQNLLRGKFFIMLDKNSAMHKNHIFKAVNVLQNCDNLYCYSGSYIRRQNAMEQTIEYETLNSRPIEQKYFFSYLNPSAHLDLALRVEKICPITAFLFNKEVLNHVAEEELEQISIDLQLYFAGCSQIKAKRLGKFMYSLTAGYKLLDTDDENKILFPQNKIYYSQGKCQNTYIKELLGVFTKYDIEIPFDENFGKLDKRTKKIIKKLKKYKILSKFIYKYNKNLPEYCYEYDFYLYLIKNKRLKKRLYWICRWL